MEDSIKLPDELKPADGRFGCGPSKVREEAVSKLEKLSKSVLGTSHRQKPVKSLVAGLRENLKALFSLPEGYEVILGNGGATAFWDAATFCLIEGRSQHLSFGEFSSKFAQAAKRAPHLKDPEIIESDYGTHPEICPNEEIDFYALTQNETSTGVYMEVSRPANLNENSLIAVDATSAAGGIEVSCEDFDIYYFSPQKCFGSEGGLFVALLSEASARRINALTSARWVPAFLDLALAIENSVKDQTYNTPSISTLILMNAQIEWFLENGGLNFSAGRCKESAEIIYSWAEKSEFATPFVKKEADRSPVVATIDFEDRVDALKVARILRDNSIVDIEPYRKLGRNQIRVGLFPSVEPSDVQILCQAIDYVVERIS